MFLLLLYCSSTRYSRSDCDEGDSRFSFSNSNSPLLQVKPFIFTSNVYTQQVLSEKTIPLKFPTSHQMEAIMTVMRYLLLTHERNMHNDFIYTHPKKSLSRRIK